MKKIIAVQKEDVSFGSLFNWPSVKWEHCPGGKHGIIPRVNMSDRAIIIMLNLMENESYYHSDLLV